MINHAAWMVEEKVVRHKYPGIHDLFRTSRNVDSIGAHLKTIAGSMLYRLNKQTPDEILWASSDHAWSWTHHGEEDEREGGRVIMEKVQAQLCRLLTSGATDRAASKHF